jgi:hypothetical protein
MELHLRMGDLAAARGDVSPPHLNRRSLAFIWAFRAGVEDPSVRLEPIGNDRSDVLCETIQPPRYPIGGINLVAGRYVLPTHPPTLPEF